MKATHFDHQHDWYKYCECEDCRLKYDEYANGHGEWSYVPTSNHGGLQWEGAISCFAHEPIVFLLRCYRCDKLYVALEPVGETPVIYPISLTEEDALTGMFYTPKHAL